MNGRKSKQRHKLTEANLRAAVLHNYHAAAALHGAFVSLLFQNLFAQIAMAALLQHLENHAEAADGRLPWTSTVSMGDIEKAVLFVPPEGEAGPTI